MDNPILLKFLLNYPDKLLKKYMNFFLLHGEDKAKIFIKEDLVLKETNTTYYVYIIAIKLN